MGNSSILYTDDNHVKMRLYAQAWRDRKKLIKNIGEGKKPLRNVPVSFIKSVEPTHLNFTGTDDIVICSGFGCGNLITYEHQLYNSKCYSCQCKEKPDINKYLSFPIKKTG